MDDKGLLFLPDISGFTRFVNETEIRHSSLIIQELLEVLINANQIGLEISEIEGDAILFYKFGDSPDLEELYRQVESMFCAFHRHLISYEHRRLCQCTACMAAAGLTLKVVSHYGEFTGYQVKDFYKLIGKDVIVAHQLLKNDISRHEYWLVTDNLLHDHPLEEFKGWMEWMSSAKQTEVGEIPFHYAQLSELRNEIPPEPSTLPDLSGQIMVLSDTETYHANLYTVLHVTACFDFRSKWQDGVTGVDEINHHLPRVGSRYRCITEHGSRYMHISGFHYTPERVEFCEADDKRTMQTRFVFEKLSEQETRLTLELYLNKGGVRNMLYRLMEKKKSEASYRRSLEGLGAFLAAMHRNAAT